MGEIADEIINDMMDGKRDQYGRLRRPTYVDFDAIEKRRVVSLFDDLTVANRFDDLTQGSKK